MYKLGVFNGNINVRRPKNYFERFYSVVWDEFFGHKLVPHATVAEALQIEISKYGLSIEWMRYKYNDTAISDYETYTVYAKSEEDALAFKLKFAL